MITTQPITMAHWNAADRSDADFIRLRLERASAVYIAERDRQLVALDMQKLNQVVCAWGTGKEAGLLICRKPTRPYPTGRQS